MKITFLLVLILGFSSSSFADNHKEHKGRGKHSACKADIEKFCASVEKGEGRIVRCLKENEAQLSTECKEHRDNMKSKIKENLKEAHAVCEADIDKFCEDVEPRKGAILKCLKKNKDEVSAECREFFQRKR